MEIFLKNSLFEKFYLSLIKINKQYFKNSKSFNNKTLNYQEKCKKLKKNRFLDDLYKGTKNWKQSVRKFQIDLLETKFNQFAELKESILLSKLSLNDPLDIEQKIPTTYIPCRKIMKCWCCKKPGYKAGICYHYYKNKRKLQKDIRKYFLDLLHFRWKILKEKILQFYKESATFSMQLMNSIRNKQESIYRKSLEKKIMRIYGRNDPSKFEITFIS